MLSTRQHSAPRTRVGAWVGRPPGVSPPQERLWGCLPAGPRSAAGPRPRPAHGCGGGGAADRLQHGPLGAAQLQQRAGPRLERLPTGTRRPLCRAGGGLEGAELLGGRGAMVALRAAHPSLRRPEWRCTPLQPGCASAWHDSACCCCCCLRRNEPCLLAWASCTCWTSQTKRDCGGAGGGGTANLRALQELPLATPASLHAWSVVKLFPCPRAARAAVRAQINS